MSDFIETRLNDGTIIFGTAGGPQYKTAIAQTNGGREQRNAVWSQPLSLYEFIDRKITEDEAHYIRDFFNAVGGMAIGFRFKDWADYQDDGNGVVNLAGMGNGTSAGQLYKRYPAGPITRARKISKPIAGVAFFVNGAPATATLDTTTGAVTWQGSTKTVTAAVANGTATATLTIAGHGYATGESIQFSATGGWSILAGFKTVTVVDANTITVAGDYSAAGAFSTASATRFPQSTDFLTWTGEFDVPVRFDEDSMSLSMSSAQVISPGTLGMKAFDLHGLKLMELKL